jgi:hypothetical protein
VYNEIDDSFEEGLTEVQFKGAGSYPYFEGFPGKHQPLPVLHLFFNPGLRIQSAVIVKRRSVKRDFRQKL